MKIRLKKKRIYTNLILGLFWTVLGIIKIVGYDHFIWTDYFYFIAGTLFIGHYVYDTINQYLTVDTRTIRKNILYGKGRKLVLDEIISIKSIAGNYILQTESQKMKIKTDLIDESSLAELRIILDELNLPSDKTPFANNGYHK